MAQELSTSPGFLLAQNKAEELWKAFAGKADDSVCFHTWHELPFIAHAEGLIAKWERLRELRTPVRKRMAPRLSDGCPAACCENPAGCSTTRRNTANPSS